MSETGIKVRRGYHDPFARTPEALLDANLPDRAKVLWSVLDRYADSDRHAWPSRETLANRMRCSHASIDRALAALEESGWLHIERRLHRPGLSNETSIYTLLNPAATVVTGDDSYAQESGEPVVTGEEEKESQGNENPPTPLRAVPESPWPSAVGGVAAKPDERELVDAILDDFNRQAGTRYSRTTDARRLVVTRIREHPDLTFDQHSLMIEAVLAHPWWKDEPPTPRVVYGHGRIEQSLEYLRAAARSAQSDRARSQALDASMAEGRARHAAELEAARSPEARAVARAMRAALPRASR